VTAGLSPGFMCFCSLHECFYYVCLVTCLVVCVFIVPVVLCNATIVLYLSMWL
jgi:hypothetical protein